MNVWSATKTALVYSDGTVALMASMELTSTVVFEENTIIREVSGKNVNPLVMHQEG